MSLILIDSSVWVNLLRHAAPKGDLSRLKSLLETRQAAWCGIIQLELWSGVRDGKQRKYMEKLGVGLRDLEITKAVWVEAFHIAALARSKGITTPASDHLIFACARVHNAEIWHCDKHFDALGKL